MKFWVKPAAELAFLKGVFMVRAVNVLALTLFISICLAGIFIVCFAAEVRRARRSSPERDSLLPLDIETTRPPTVASTADFSILN